MKLLLTGGTGVIGKELVKQLLEGEEELFLLVRSEESMQRHLQQIGVQDSNRIHLLVGDLRKPRLALDDAAYQKALTADTIIHAGGTMDIALGEEQAKQTFLDGAVHLAQLAREIAQQRKLSQFIHVVGYMSPFHEGNVSSDVNVFEIDAGFHREGAYERMKFLADLYIRQEARRHGYALAVMNPATVIGARPAGVTEQTGGLGILVEAMNRRLMPVVPGGADHWLPLVPNDDVARSIIAVVRSPKPVDGTFTLLGDKADNPSMTELLAIIAKQMRIFPPKHRIPLSWMQRAMDFGLSRLTGIPAQSMSFITKNTFENDAAKKLFGAKEAEAFAIDDVLTQAIADLDYRLANRPAKQTKEAALFERKRLGSLSAFYKAGTGEPWVIVHGLFSHAESMLPLAWQLFEKTGCPVWVLDLPGFGRSPSLADEKEGEPIAKLLDALMQAIVEIPGTKPFRLVGHSMGAFLSANVFARLADRISRLVLLQPVFMAPHDRLLKWASVFPSLLRLMLRQLRAKTLAKRLITSGAVVDENKEPLLHAEAIVRQLCSLRMSYANAHMLHLLFHHASTWPQPVLPSVGTTIVWGELDKAYRLPSSAVPVKPILLPYGHQFPLTHAEATATLLAEEIDANLVVQKMFSPLLYDRMVRNDSL